MTPPIHPAPESMPRWTAQTVGMGAPELAERLKRILDTPDAYIYAAKGRAMGLDSRPDFEYAMGEAFGEHVCPPVRFEDASPHECCEVVWQIVGRGVAPSTLASLTDAQVELLSLAFGRYFETPAPSVGRIKEAIAGTLARWPVGSLGEMA